MELGLITRDDLGEGVQQIDTPWASVIFGFPGKNGICILNKMPGDPPEVRLVSMDGNSGKISWCVGADAATAVEHVMMNAKTDERVRGTDLPRYGSLSLHILSPIKNPADPRDDGIYEVARFLHDYTWFNNLDLSMPPFPIPPRLDVNVPAPAPDVPPVPSGPTPDEQETAAWLADDAKHRDELDAIAAEFAAVGGPLFVPDEKTREAYRSGRNKNLRSIHDDMVDRYGSDPGPCQWKL